MLGAESPNLVAQGREHVGEGGLGGFGAVGLPTTSGALFAVLAGDLALAGEVPSGRGVVDAFALVVGDETVPALDGVDQPLLAQDVQRRTGGRGLQKRARKTTRPVPIPLLVRMIREHVEEFDAAEDRRLFRAAHGGHLLSEEYGEVWTAARFAVLTESEAASTLADVPYSLPTQASRSGWSPMSPRPR
jgi:hypothetical protein